MTSDLPTGRTVTLPLVWRDQILWLGDVMRCGQAYRPYRARKWDASIHPDIARNGGYLRNLGSFPTRSAAMRAVEQAVMRALGAEG